jgi:predicted lipid-binding transport protein (Tim44 family)
MRKPRNADEGVWGGFLAGLASLTLAAVIVYRMATGPDSLFWDILLAILITAVTVAAFTFMTRSRKSRLF